MAIYNPGKYYLVSVDETENVCCVSPFNVERVEQTFGDVFTFRGDRVFNSDYIAPTITKVEGQLYGTMRILKPKELINFENVSCEEIMDLIKE
ncbi:MAG: hypothetical protein J6Y78_15885 [Paludibacteraceae bacterium]|nr:hypothetical protein [Paludibacteraceae bacterium]